jgi:hypothetical protein
MFMVRVATSDRSRPVVIDRLKGFRPAWRIGDVNTGMDVELTRLQDCSSASGLNPGRRDRATDYRVKITLYNVGCAGIAILCVQ